MWILSWTKYNNSKLATFISVIGALTRYGGVLCLFSGLIPAGIICLGIGIAVHFGAEAIHTNKWKSQLKKEGYAQKIINGDFDTAIAVYKAKPQKSTIKLIASYNSQLAREIEEKINNK